MKDRNHFFNYIISMVRSTGGRHGAGQPVTTMGAMRVLEAADWMLQARGRHQFRRKITRIEWPPLTDWPGTEEWDERALLVSGNAKSHISMALRALRGWMPLAVETDDERALVESKRPLDIMFARGGDIEATPEHAELLRYLDRFVRPTLTTTQVQKLQWGVHLFVDDDENVTVLDPTMPLNWANKLTTWTTRDMPTADAVRACWTATSTAAPEAFVFGSAQGGIARAESVVEWLDSAGLQRPMRRRYDAKFRRACYQATQAQSAEEEA